MNTTTTNKKTIGCRRARRHSRQGQTHCARVRSSEKAQNDTHLHRKNTLTLYLY